MRTLKKYIFCRNGIFINWNNKVSLLKPFSISQKYDIFASLIDKCTIYTLENKFHGGKLLLVSFSSMKPINGYEYF